MAFAALLDRVSLDRVLPPPLRLKVREIGVALIGAAFILSAVAAIHFDEQIAPAIERLSVRLNAATHGALSAARSVAGFEV